jgi:hypothetical protein
MPDMASTGMALAGGPGVATVAGYGSGAPGTGSRAGTAAPLGALPLGALLGERALGALPRALPPGTLLLGAVSPGTVPPAADGELSRTSASARVTSSALGRVSGSLASSVVISPASGPACSGGSGDRVRIAVMTAVSVGPPNGGRPSTAVYRVAPSAHMSAGGPASLPSSCSGAM